MQLVSSFALFLDFFLLDCFPLVLAECLCRLSVYGFCLLTRFSIACRFCLTSCGVSLFSGRPYVVINLVSPICESCILSFYFAVFRVLPPPSGGYCCRHVRCVICSPLYVFLTHPLPFCGYLGRFLISACCSPWVFLFFN